MAKSTELTVTESTAPTAPYMDTYAPVWLPTAGFAAGKIPTEIVARKCALTGNVERWTKVKAMNPEKPYWHDTTRKGEQGRSGLWINCKRSYWAGKVSECGTYTMLDTLFPNWQEEQVAHDAAYQATIATEPTE